MDLSKLPREALKGLDKNSVENERKQFWNKFFEKYEEIGAKCNTTVSLDEIDKPEKVAETFKIHNKVVLGFPYNRTVKKWINDNGDEIDELTTIAGPITGDEEELFDDDYSSSDDDLADLIDDKENNPTHDENCLLLNDASFSSLVVISDCEKDGDKVDVKRQEISFAERDLEQTPSPPSSPILKFLNTSDSDAELYTPATRAHSRSIFAPLVENRNYKNKALFSPQLSSSLNTSIAASPRFNLICNECSNVSDYSKNLGLEESLFRCDSCMLSDTHPECGEQCDKCIEIAAELDARWIHRGMVENVIDVGSNGNIECDEEKIDK